MKMNMYSVYDSVAEVFNKPFTEHNNASAIRVFRQALKDNPNKEDYGLYHIGTFLDSNGTLLGEKVQKVITGFDLKEDDNNEIGNAA
jgi:hypothetical protein